MRGAYVAAAVAVALLAAVAAPASAQSGVGVWNAPPTFYDIKVGEVLGYVVVNVTISDQNGRADLFYLTVVVVDGNGDVVSNVTYSQHDTNTSYDTIHDVFTDSQGGFLVEDRCIVQRFSGLNWFRDNNTLQIEFWMEQFQGKTIRVTGVDVKHATCFSEGPFSSAYRPEPAVRDVRIPLGVSLIVAAIVSMFFVYRRLLSNRLAKKIAGIERAHAEEGD
jgi:hypothetical protein